MFQNAFIAIDLYPGIIKLHMPNFYNLLSTYSINYNDIYEYIENIYTDNISFITNILDKTIEDYYNKQVIWSLDILINLCVIKYIQYLYNYPLGLDYIYCLDYNTAKDYVIKNDCIRITNKFNSDPNNIYNSLFLEVSLLDYKDLDNARNINYYNNKLEEIHELIKQAVLDYFKGEL